MATIVTRETTQTDGTSPKGSPLTNAEVDTNFINLNDDKVEVSGAIIFQAKAGEALSKGDVVYVSGVSGNEPVVSKADADDAAKMPAYGLAEDAASLNAAVNVVTFGTLYDLDTSSFAAGDTVYVSTTAGAITTTAPTGESSLLQNIGTVIRSHASAGSIKVGGAGRTNATPNLNDGNVFIGNASNQAAARALTTSDIQSGTFADARIAESNVTQHQAALSITESQISDLQAYLTAETNDLSSAVTWANVPDANITQSSVTQHEAALSITESQISDLQAYLTAESDTLDSVTDRGATTTNAITVGNLTSTGIDVTGNVTLESSDAGSGEGPEIFLHRNSASPAASDVIGVINFDGENSAGSQHTYGKIKGVIVDPTNTSEDGKLVFQARGAGAAFSDIMTVASTGIDVTGTVVSDGLTVDGTGDLGTIGNGAFNAAAALGFQSDRAFFGYSSSQNALIQSGASKGVVVEVNSDTLDSGTRAALFASNGDISFYEDTGTTQAFFWDASAESLGIGTTSPSAPLAINSATNNAYGVRIGVDDPGTGTVSGVRLGFDVKSIGGNPEPAAYIGVEEASTSSVQGALVFATRQTNNNTVAPAEAMRLNSSGDLLVGGITNDTPGLGDTDVGASFRADGASFVSRTLSDTSGSTFYVNRNTNDGNLIQFQKNGTTIGSIEVVGSDQFRINATSSNLQLLRDSTGTSRGLNFGVDHFKPFDSNDNQIDLGTSSGRFKDIYLSGGAYLGGTAAANKLDDYEEGVHVTTLTPGTSGTITLNSSFDTLGYTKIGRLVHITGSVTVSSVSSPVGNIQVSLPFVIASTSEQSERFGGLVQVNRSSINVNEFSYTGSEGNSYIVIQKASGTEISSDSAETFGGNEYIYFDFTYYTS